MLVNLFLFFRSNQHPFCQNICCTLCEENLSMWGLVQGGHQLSVRIKRNFCKTRILAAEVFCLHAVFLRKANQCCFCWVTNFGFSLTGCITTQNRCDNQPLFIIVFQIHIFFCNAVSMGNDFPNGHFILGQCSGFIRTNNRNRA